MLSDKLKIKEPEAGQVTVEGQKIACSTQQIESEQPGHKTVVTVWYSDTLAPFILRRQSTTTELESGEVVAQSTSDVVARQMPWRTPLATRDCALIKTQHRHAKGSTTTWAYTCADVPGGIVSHSSKEVDENGRLQRRSTLELVEYDHDCEPARMGFFRMRRPRLRSTVN